MANQEGMIRSESKHSQSDHSADLGIASTASLHSTSVRESLTHEEDEKKGRVAEEHGGWKLENFCRPVMSSISAGLYLFDCVSNVLVLKEYYDMKVGGQYELNWTTFGVCFGLMVVAHVLNAVSFKLKLPSEEYPIKSAYFLPLMQFRRVVSGIWNSRTLGRTTEIAPESREAEALYAIMCALMETGPQLGLQFCYIVCLATLYPSWKPGVILNISIAASFLSGAYNTGRAVMYKLSDRWTWTLNAVGFVGGVYAVGALLLRCTATASVILYLQVNINLINFDIGLIIYFILVAGPFTLAIGAVSLGRSERFFTTRAQLHVWVGAYISLFLGPLYPPVDGYSRDKKQKSTTFLLYRLPIAVFLNLVLDIATLSYITAIKWNACNYRQSEEFVHFRDDLSWTLQTDLSATFTCSQFLGYAALGFGLSVVSACILVCLLATSASRIAS